jgi:cytochrome c oxidase subunit 6a
MASLARCYAKFYRGLSTSAVARMSGDAGAHGGGYGVWKKVFFLGAIPAVIIANINAFVVADAPEPPPHVPYEYLYIRSKKFPWGDGNHSLFHNSHMNALPEGYEHGDEGH